MWLCDKRFHELTLDELYRLLRLRAARVVGLDWNRPSIDFPLGGPHSMLLEEAGYPI